MDDHVFFLQGGTPECPQKQCKGKEQGHSVNVRWMKTQRKTLDDPISSSFVEQGGTDKK